MSEHERLQELLAAAAMDGVDPQGEAELARLRDTHGHDCIECRRAERDFGEAAGRLAFALEPRSPRAGLEDELIARATGRGTGSRVVSLEDARSRRRGGAWKAAVGIAAGFMLFASGWVVRDATEPTDGGEAAAIAGARVVTFEGADGNLSIAYRPGQTGVYILGSALPAPPEGSVYEVWMIQDDVPVAGPCLSPEADGTLFTYVEAELGTTDTMAVTLESSSCPSEPTGDPILTADLTAV